MKEKIWLPNEALVLCIDTCVHNSKIYQHKQGERNMSTKQGIHKWHRWESINVAAQKRSVYAYYCWVKNLLAFLLLNYFF